MFKYRKGGDLESGSEEDIMSVVVGESESAVNCFLTLYLLKHSDNRIDGITKLQKHTFAIQNEMEIRCISAISGEFFRWNYGPMSDEVYGTSSFLVENDLVEDRALILTERGDKLLEDFEYIIDNNKEIFAIIDKYIDNFSHLNLHDLKERIYSMIVILAGDSEPKTIKDLPLGTTIIRNKGFSSLNIDDDDLESLEIYLNEEMYQSVLNGVNDARSGRISNLEIA